MRSPPAGDALYELCDVPSPIAQFDECISEGQEHRRPDGHECNVSAGESQRTVVIAAGRTAAALSG
jgi:hypothetical protein